MGKNVFVYTDGACKGNPGPGGYGVLIKMNGASRRIKGGEKHTTNNRMELTGAIEGLRAVTEPSDITLVSDSIYVIKGMREWMKSWIKKGWKNASGKPVKNRELWEELNRLSKPHTIRWQWIKGHNGHPENELCDLLANQAIDEL